MRVETVVAERINATTFVPAWAKDAIFYQIFPERFANGDPSNDPPNVEPWGGEPKVHNYFGGDLKGIIDHLDYISALGVNCLYLNPIFWSTSNHKYHAKDYFKIDPHLGDESVFKHLVNACHARGIRIILDGVFNHTGVDFFAFEDVKKHGKNSRYVKWFNIYNFPVSSPRKPNYECWWNLGELPKLMVHEPEVRRYLFKVTEYWMKFGIDGWRLDVPNEISHAFWIEWRKLVKSLNPEAYIVGEIWDDGSSWLQGDQFDAVMNYRFRRSCVEFFAKRTMTPSEFDRSLARTRALYPDEVNYVLQNLLGSHDTERFLTVCNGNKAAMKLAWLFQMTYIGAPMVYYGDEVGMTGGKDPGCRGTMIWDEDKQDRELLAEIKVLIKIRNQYSVFRLGTFASVLVDDDRLLFGFTRNNPIEGTQALVILNNSDDMQEVDLQPYTNFSSITWQQIWPRNSGKSFETANNTYRLEPRTGIIFIGGTQP